MSKSFDLMAAKLEAVKAQMLADLNREIFAVGATTRLTRQLPWRIRVAMKVGRVRAYFSTLWLALKGDDPYDSW